MIMQKHGHLLLTQWDLLTCHVIFAFYLESGEACNAVGTVFWMWLLMTGLQVVVQHLHVTFYVHLCPSSL